MKAFLTGAVAGYGIAVPVGAIAILIIQTGMKRGFPRAFAAGAGAATADLIYSSLAVIGGSALVGVVDAAGDSLRILSGAALVVIAILGLSRSRSHSESAGPTIENHPTMAGTYTRFLGLTLVNPATIVYFGAVIIGLGVAAELTPGAALAFVVGAFMASLSWQALLAAVGGYARTRISSRAQTVAIVAGNLVILGLAVVILIE